MPGKDRGNQPLHRWGLSDGNMFKLEGKWCVTFSPSSLCHRALKSNNEQPNSCLRGRNWGESEAVRGGPTGPSWSLQAVPDIKGSPTSVLVGIPGNSGCFVLVCTIFRHWGLHADLCRKHGGLEGRAGAASTPFTANIVRHKRSATNKMTLGDDLQRRCRHVR